MKKIIIQSALVLLIASFALLGAPALHAQRLAWTYDHDPWVNQGYVFDVPVVDAVPDLHGNPSGAKLTLFIGGNQFMVLPQLVQAFEHEHPELRGHIFYETLPPGILARQMAHGGTLTLGSLTLTAEPDVYEAGAKRVDSMAASGALTGVARYATNDLMIMVRRGNPKAIRSLADLARPGVRLSMPNPAWEGVARLIEASLNRAGGQSLVKEIMETKRQRGETFLTEIHHRQTPLRILNGLSDAGVTWQSEVRFQQSIGNPIEGVAIPTRENVTGVYAAGIVRGARHPEAAAEWIKFLQTATAQAIYKSFGFGPAK